MSFQTDVRSWVVYAFGRELADDKSGRNHKFLEEALELVQALGCSQQEAHQIVEYVFARPAGEPEQEVGGVMVTLAGLCAAQGMDLEVAAEIELQRVWADVSEIRKKQALVPKFSP